MTYAGKPLYFYAHEGPGEVRCHNVDLNGGLWWVVGAGRGAGAREAPRPSIAALALALAACARRGAGDGAGTKITVRGSEYGPMLWGPGRQAIYMFENDRRGTSRAATATARRRGRPCSPRAGPSPAAAFDASLLGSTPAP